MYTKVYLRLRLKFIVNWCTIVLRFHWLVYRSFILILGHNAVLYFCSLESVLNVCQVVFSTVCISGWGSLFHYHKRVRISCLTRTVMLSKWEGERIFFFRIMFLNFNIFSLSFNSGMFCIRVKYDFTRIVGELTKLKCQWRM